MTALLFIPTCADRVREQNPTARCVLALDMATQLGAAIQHLDGRIAHHSMAFPKGRHDGERYAKFRGWLTRTHKASKFDAIFYENKTFNAGNARSDQVLWGFESNLLSWSYIYGIEPIGIDPGTIKKFITGNGGADKEAVKDAVRTLGFTPEDDNAADAIALLLLGLERLAGAAK